MKYLTIAESVLKEIGGPENVLSVLHCATRLRFRLKDEAVVDDGKVKSIDGVMTVVRSGGQVQVVIGEDVSYVFRQIEILLGKSAVTTGTEAEKPQGNIISRLVNVLSAIFMPLIGVIAATGILKGFLAAALALNLVDKTNGTYEVLFIISDAFYYFMPILLGFSAGKAFHTSPYVTATIGACLVYPQLVEFYATGKNLSFLSIPVLLMSYAQSVVPVIIAAKATAMAEVVIKKVIPVNLQSIFVPFFLLIIITPATLLAIGPASIYLSKGLAALSIGLYTLSPVVAGLILAGVWQIAIIFGLHWAFIPIFINNVSVNGFDPINAMLYCTVFAQTGAALAVALKTREVKLKATAYSATLSGFLGITEPAIYSVNLPSKKPFIMASIGSALGGATAGFFSAKMFGGFASGGVFGIPMFIAPSGLTMEFYGFLASLVIAFVVSLGLTMAIGYKAASRMETAK